VRKAEAFFRAGWLAALAAGLALGSAGCGSTDPTAGSATSAQAAKSGKRKTPLKNPADPVADMVSAVSSTKAGPPVEVKFALAARPEVGQAMDVAIAVIPRAPLPDSISASFQAAEGLEIVDGALLERVDKLVDGTPIQHVVKILPKRDGIFALTAVVNYAQANQDLARTFSIPVIAGEGLPEQVAKGP
jgi:hypothetical protein